MCPRVVSFTRGIMLTEMHQVARQDVLGSTGALLSEHTKYMRTKTRNRSLENLPFKSKDLPITCPVGCPTFGDGKGERIDKQMEMLERNYAEAVIENTLADEC